MLPKGLTVSGKFHSDTVKIGQPIVYTLVLKHPAGTQALFPDSSWNYEPFELSSRNWFRTTTDTGGIATDSVRYTLLSFSTDSAQSLALPVFYLGNGTDSNAVFSSADTVLLRSAIKNADTDSPLIADTEFREVKQRINYPYLLLGFGAVTIALILLNAFLGRPVQRAVRRVLLGRRHRIFLAAFERLENLALREKSGKRVENSLNLWKKYIERLDGVPYSTYTTKEMATAIPDDERLKRTLQTIDRCVYGGQNEVISEEIFTELRRRALLFYRKKREEIKNG
ncbi:MAG: hypothetical protein V4543_05980 [Bacteroidota bacterium]